MLSEYIGSKSHTQCKTYYNQYNKKLRFDDMRNSSLTNDDESSFSDTDAKPAKGKKGKDKFKAKKEREKREREDEETKQDDAEDQNEGETGNDKEEDEEKKEKKKKRVKDTTSPTPDEGPEVAWTPAEKQDFIKYLALYPAFIPFSLYPSRPLFDWHRYGKNWKAMASHFTKTQSQIQSYYDKNKLKLNLADLLESTKDTREPSEKKRRPSDKVYPQERRGPGR